MSLSILGGSLKGAKLSTPPGIKTRPTSVRLKRRLFDFRQNWSDHTFVDLCAGTGAIGLEAWSRGAEQVFFVEKSGSAFSVLMKNIQKIRDIDSRPHAFAGKDAKLMGFKKAASSWLANFEKNTWNTFSEEQRDNTVIYIDPPYELRKVYLEIFKKLEQFNPRFSGEIWIESDEKKGIPFKEWESLPWSIDKVFRQGDSYVAIGKFLG